MTVHGIMPMLSAREDQKFWDTHEHDAGGASQPGMCVIRTLQGRQRQELAEVVAQCRGETPHGDGPHFDRVDYTKGRRATVYTDGSVDPPAWPAYALGGAAAWRDDTQEDEDDSDENDNESSHGGRHAHITSASCAMERGDKQWKCRYKERVGQCGNDAEASDGNNDISEYGTSDEDDNEISHDDKNAGITSASCAMEDGENQWKCRYKEEGWSVWQR